jgi:dTDP-4-amino-4,6-dideoxygalactose transaminase
VTLNTGTSALHLAMLCLGVGPGDEVIVPAMTFIATAWGPSYVGAKPVFVDIDPVRRTLDPQLLEAAITPRTKAIIPVHLYGMPSDMDAILAIADKHGIPVVEDAAQAQGARYKSQRSEVWGQQTQVSGLGPLVSGASPQVWKCAGSMGTMACTSFYPSKNLGGFGEGGALLTNDDNYAARARQLRDHAQRHRYDHVEIGYNYRMDGIQGAVLSVKLKHLDTWNSQRLAHAQRYNELLAGLSITLPSYPADSESVCHLYVIECENRDQVRERLAAAGVDTAIHYPTPLHLQPAYAHLGGTPGDCPVSERLAQRAISLPLYPELTEEQIQTVVTALQQALS